MNEINNKFTVSDIIKLDCDSESRDLIEIYNTKPKQNILIWSGNRIDYFSTIAKKGNTKARETEKYDNQFITGASFITTEDEQNNLIMLVSIYL